MRSVTESIEGPAADAPDWFRQAVAQRPEESSVTVEGADIEFLAWGERGRPGLLLAPGSRAHAHWWSFAGPLLARSRRVAALSFSGMGRSDHRERYSTVQLAEELLAVAEAAGLSDRGPPILVGLSLAGLPLVQCAIRHPDRVGGLILVDSLLRMPAPLPGIRTQADPVPPQRIYPSREAAMRTFRPVPPTLRVPDYILDHLAHHGLKAIDPAAPESGWIWRYDRNFVSNLEWHDEERLLHQVHCPVALIRGEESPVLSEEVVHTMTARLPAGAIVRTIADAGHHIVAEQPLALITQIEGIIAQWHRSRKTN